MRGANKSSSNQQLSEQGKEHPFDLATAYTALIAGWKRKLEEERSAVIELGAKQEK